MQSKKRSVNDVKDWHDIVQIGSAFEDKRHEVLHALKPFHNTWDDHLGLMSNVSHEIDLVAGTTPCQKVPLTCGHLDARHRDGRRGQIEGVGNSIPVLTDPLGGSHSVCTKKYGALRLCVNYRGFAL